MPEIEAPRSVPLIRKWTWLVLIALGIGAYGPSLFNGFVWDDQVLIVENADIKDGARLGSFFRKEFFMSGSRNPSYRAGAYYRPLVNMSFASDFKLWGLEPSGYHLTNLMLHIANGIMVLYLARRVIGWGYASAGAAAFFVVHPAHAAAVSYVSGRTDLLSTLAALGAFSLFIQDWHKGRVSHPVSVVAGSLLFGAGLLSKEIAVCFPLLLILYGLCFPGASARKWRKLGVWMCACAVVFAAYFVLRARALQFMGSDLFHYMGGLGLRSMATARVVLGYMKEMLLPAGFGVQRFVPVPSGFGVRGEIASALTLVVLVAGVVRLRKWSAAGAYGALWFLAALAPVSNVVPIHPARPDTVFAAEQFLYLPSVGFILLVAAVLQAAGRKWPGLVRARKMTAAVLCAIIVCFGVVSAVRSRDWRDDVTFYTKMIRSGTATARIHANLGRAYAGRGRFDDAEREFKVAIGLDPGDAAAHFQYGVFLGNTGKTAAAISEYRKAVALNPFHLDAMVNLGIDLGREGSLAEAVGVLEKAAELDPTLAAAHYNLGVVYWALGKRDEALSQWRLTLVVDPAHWKARERLREAIAGAGR